MADRSELVIVALVLIGAALALLAPWLGRGGAELAANAAVIGAGLAGIGAFAVALAETIRAMRGGGTDKGARR